MLELPCGGVKLCGSCSEYKLRCGGVVVCGSRTCNMGELQAVGINYQILIQCVFGFLSLFTRFLQKNISFKNSLWLDGLPQLILQ